MDQKVILITGATGLLGSTLVPFLRDIGYTIATQARSSNAAYLVDLADVNETCALLDRLRPSIIINLVGLTSVERCESHLNEAYVANTRTVENLVRWIRESNLNSHLVQVSTDHVYDGMRLHTEDHVTITNNYAFSKYAGELAAAQVPSTILRTNFIGHSKTKNRISLTDWVYTSVTSGKHEQVLQDVFFSPLSMNVLAEMIQLVIERKPIGIFNLGSHSGMSKADFDFTFAECLGFPTSTMSRIDSSQATFLKAYRPKDMRMECSKFENTLGVKLPLLSDEIKRVAMEYHHAA